MSESLNNRSNDEPRLLTYPRNHRVLYWYLVIVGAVSLIFASILMWYYFNNKHNAYDFLYIVAIYIISGSLFFLSHKYSHHLHRIQVYKDHLLIHKNKQQHVLRFSDIVKVELKMPQNPYQAFLMVLELKDGSKYPINGKLHRPDYVLKAIYHFAPNLFKHVAYENVLSNVLSCDHNNSRLGEMNESFYKVAGYVFLVSIPIFFIAFLNMKISAPFHFYYNILHRLFLFTIVPWIIVSGLLVVRMRTKDRMKLINEPGRVARDFSEERDVHRKFLATSLIYITLLGVSFVRFDLIFLNISRLSNTAAYLGYNKGQYLLVDSRYTCLDCTWALTYNDVILVNGTFGKIVGLPGDRYAPRDNNRQIASQETDQVVPKNFVAVLTNGGQSTILVSLNLIQGKTTTIKEFLVSPNILSKK